jgi:hypothetical protein
MVVILRGASLAGCAVVLSKLNWTDADHAESVDLLFLGVMAVAVLFFYGLWRKNKC